MDKVIKLFLVVIILLGIFLIGASFYIKHKLSEEVYIKEPKHLSIKKGLSIKDISNLLKEKGIIKNKELFYLYSKFKNKPLKAGYYIFEGKYSIPKVWEVLYKGKEKLIPFKIIPGDDLFNIANNLSRTFNIDKNKIMEYVFNPENVKKNGLIGLSFEGYFPPETYMLRKDSNIEDIVKVFVSFFKKKYEPLLKSSKEFSPYEVMIISSLVEKETALKEEKPLIAGVIINRIRRGMLLQIDPTTIYALKLAGKWEGKLTKDNIHFNSIYNTYVYKGLPPTPICSFSLDTLKSVLNYKKTSYLYYLSKNGKSHIFSKTYREHINALKGYGK